MWQWIMQIRDEIMQIWGEAGICRVGVLLFDAFSNLCLANAVEPLRAANTLARRRLYEWQFLSMDGAPVTSSGGLPVTPELPLTQAAGDILLVMPSYRFRDHARAANLRGLRAAARRWPVLAGLDTGSWLLAAAGLLDGYRATIHWDELAALAETFPEVDVAPERFVTDRNRLSCGGGVTGLDLALDLIRRRNGPMLAIEVAALFMHGTRPLTPDLPDLPPGDGLVHAAVALMRRSLEQPLPVPEIAAALGTDRKTLERAFAKGLGTSPRAVAKAVRLREARRLAEHTRQSVAEIATRCGYADASALTRAFRAEFGLTPRDCRSAVLNPPRRRA